jgi:hypothetical protein
MTSGQIHVVPRADGEWSVHREGESEPLSVHCTAWLAEKAALKHASDEDAAVVVHGASRAGTQQHGG